MAREFVETLAIEPVDVLVSNTDVENTLFTRTIPGGTLGSINRLRFTVQGKFSLVNDSTTLTIRFKYGSSVASVTISANGSSFADVAFVAKVYLSADESAAIQAATIAVMTGLSRPEQTGFPTRTVMFAENSNGDLVSSVTAQFDTINSANALTHYHTTIEKISYIENPIVNTPELPLTKIVLLSALNNLSESLYKAHTLYASLTHDLQHSGIGTATFVRPTASTAIWRDGAAHAVAINEPRFSYDGATPRGLLFSQAAGEVLTFHTANLLHDSNPLCWVENGSFKYTPLNGNPFAANGQLSITGPSYIRSLLKFGSLGRALTAPELITISRIIL